MFYLPSACLLRELAGDVCRRPEDLVLYDYLFATAATLREGFALSSRFMHLVTVGSELRIESETDRDTTYAYSFAEDNRGPDLALQKSVALLCERAREATGRHVTPVRSTFHAATAKFTFLARDLDLPMRWADPVLTGVLIRHAESLPPRRQPSWLGRFREQLREAVEDGSASLEALARRFLISRRTLQRRLAEHGTTWRRELDAVRHRLFTDAGGTGVPATQRLAHELGFTDERSLRRARRRWENLSPA